MQVLFSVAFIVQQISFFYLPPGKPRDIAFTHQCFSACKDGDIVNKVYCSSSGSLILGVQIVHISKGEGELTLSNTNTICYVPLPLSSSPQFNYFALPQFFPSFYLFLNQPLFFIL